MDCFTYVKKRNSMNKINKGDIVILKNLQGQRFIVEHFDYGGLLIGLRRIHINNSEETRILWADPELIIPTGLISDRHPEEMQYMKIKNVIFNDPATIVFWSDGSKTVVKAHLDDYDPEKGLAMAIAKKALGNGGNYYNVFKKWLPKDDNSEEIRYQILNDITKKCVNEIFDEAVKKKLENFRSRFENDERTN